MVDYSSIPRDSRRVPLATKVQFKFDRFSGFISEYSANISPTGMFIVSSAPEPPGRILDLEFRLGDGFEIIQGKGEVVWSRSVAEGPLRPPGMGIRFLEMSEGSKDLIYRIVDRYVQEGGIPFDLTSARDRIEEAEEVPASLEVPAAALADLPPLDLEQNPFPDLDLDPVKDSSGIPLPWFSAAPGAAAAGKETTAAPAAPAHLQASQEEEPFELFPSIGPALEEIEPSLPREEPPAPQAPPSPAAPPPPLLFPGAAAAPPPRAERPPASPASPSSTAVLSPLPAKEPFPPPAPPVAAPVDLFAAFDPIGLAAPLPEAAAAPLPEPPPSGPGLFADYLPKPAPPASTPARRPLASLAGSAAAPEEPRRVFPWVLLGVLVAVGVAAFLLRAQIPGWLGLGGEEEIASVNPPPLHRRPRPAAETPAPQGEEGSLTSGLTADAATSALEPPPVVSSTALEPTPAPSPTPRPAPTPVRPAQAAPPSEAVQRKPAPSTAGPAATAVERITFERSMGGTDIVLWGNGAILPASYTSSQMANPPRALIRLTGIQRPFAQAKISVGTPEAKQVRSALHPGNELHVVIDLGAADIKITRIDQDGQRLRIHLQKG